MMTIRQEIFPKSMMLIGLQVERRHCHLLRCVFQLLLGACYDVEGAIEKSETRKHGLDNTNTSPQQNNRENSKRAR